MLLFYYVILYIIWTDKNVIIISFRNITPIKNNLQIWLPFPYFFSKMFWSYTVVLQIWHWRSILSLWVSHSEMLRQNILIWFLSSLLKHSKEALEDKSFESLLVEEILLACGCFIEKGFSGISLTAGTSGVTSSGLLTTSLGTLSKLCGKMESKQVSIKQSRI